jgi:hypothetical protein
MGNNNGHIMYSRSHEKYLSSFTNNHVKCLNCHNILIVDNNSFRQVYNNNINNVKKYCRCPQCNAVNSLVLL